jgi:hypothetical protein
MSTLCRAKWNGQGNDWGERPSRSLGGASRAALPVKDVFGGTPNTARETHALQTHLSDFLKGRVKEGRRFRIIRKFSEIFRENSPFPKKFRIIFFGMGVVCVRVSQSQSKWVKPVWGRAEGRRLKANIVKLNDLQHKQLYSGRTMINLVNHGQN